MDKLNLQAPINALSYGVIGLNITLELNKLLGNGNISLWPIGNSSVNTSQEDAAIIQKCIDNSRTINCDPYSPSVRIFHQFSLLERIGKGKAVGWPIFELNKFNDLELLHLNSLDQIIVCSQWAKNIVKENNIGVDCAVVPLGVNGEIFKPEPEVSSRIQPWKTTRFLAAGKIEVRKSHDILHELFNLAFESNDDVELWLAWHNHFLSEAEIQEWQDLYKNTKLGDKIKFVPYVQHPQQLNTIYNSVDCLISLSRAEGWNLPLLEGLACGRQVIATGYSGHTEFLNKDNSMLVQVEDLETAYDGKWFHGQGEWASLGDSQIEEAISYMRLIHKYKQEGADLFNKEGLETAKLFSWENSAKMLLEAINV